MLCQQMFVPPRVRVVTGFAGERAPSFYWLRTIFKFNLARSHSIPELFQQIARRPLFSIIHAGRYSPLTYILLPF
jgi:hypothetical protein